MYVLDFVRGSGIWFEALLHSPASSATKRAGCVHVPGRRVAKAVLVRTGDSYSLAVLPSTSRIDLERFSEVVGEPLSRVRVATSDEVFALFPTASQALSRRSVDSMDLKPSSTWDWRSHPKSSSWRTRGMRACECGSTTFKRSKSPCGRRLAGRGATRPTNRRRNAAGENVCGGLSV